MDCCCIFN